MNICIYSCALIYMIYIYDIYIYIYIYIYDIDGLVKTKPFHLLVHLLRKEIKPTGQFLLKIEIICSVPHQHSSYFLWI